MLKPAATVTAFAATRYRIQLGGESVELRIGHADTVAEARLLRQLPAVQHWVLITSDNPGAQRLSPDVNCRARRRLRAQLDRGGWRRAPTRHLDPHLQWPTEFGCCVADLPLAEADRLMQRHGQLAVVVWPHGSAPLLRWQDAFGARGGQ